MFASEYIQTLNSDGAMGAITRVGSFPAPLDRRKYSTSKLVSGPALAFNLQNVQIEPT